MPGKYEGTHPHRDQALHTIACEDWANESDGNVSAPTGYFWLLIITEAELSEIREAFAEFPDDVLAECVGAWLLTEDSQGFVHVQQYPDQYPDRTGEDRALVAFQAKQRDYLQWSR